MPSAPMGWKRHRDAVGVVWQLKIRVASSSSFFWFLGLLNLTLSSLLPLPPPKGSVLLSISAPTTNPLSCASAASTITAGSGAVSVFQVLFC